MIIIVFGVSGSGKTTVGQLLAKELGWEFFDADDFHSPANVEKMRNGIPLTDEDRGDWLDGLRDLISEKLAGGNDAVLACSALKEGYRQKLAVSGQVKFAYLKGDHRLIAERLADRKDHYMPPGLLQSQFDTLEEPESDVLTLDAELSPDDLVKQITASWRLAEGSKQ